MSKSLEYLKRKSKIYGLEVEIINDYTAKVYNPKINYDSWLLKDEVGYIELWHLSKKHHLEGCYYHLQERVKKKYRINALRIIKKHDSFKYKNSKYKGKNLANLVDRVMYKDSLKKSKNNLK